MDPTPRLFSLLPPFAEVMETYRSSVMSAGVIILALSGGADSVCLLYHLLPWCRENSVRLVAAHVHHGIRGLEADRDEAFCRELAEKLSIEYCSLRADVPAIAKKEKTGLEETARQVRYAYFDDLSKKLTGRTEGAIIATAHNADDNLETVLFHLLRGSGLGGLCGIDPFRDGRILRPLLGVSGKDIRSWCRKNDLDYVIDSTNGELSYARNHIRHRVCPALSAISSDPAVSVTRLTALLRQDDDFIAGEARKIYESKPLSRKKLAALHPALSSRVLTMLYNEKKDSTATLEEKHIRRALELLKSPVAKTSLSLPGKMMLCLCRDSVSVEPDEGRRKNTESAEKKPAAPFFTYPKDGETCTFDPYSLSFSQKKHNIHPTIPNKDENIYKLSILTILRFDKIVGELTVRFRRPGDRYVYGGMTHKVKRMFSDKKMSDREKDRWPLLCDDEGIVWIPSFPPRDGMAYRGEGNPLTLCFTVLPNQDGNKTSEEL